MNSTSVTSTALSAIAEAWQDGRRLTDDDEFEQVFQLDPPAVAKAFVGVWPSRSWCEEDWREVLKPATLPEF